MAHLPFMTFFAAMFYFLFNHRIDRFFTFAVIIGAVSSSPKRFGDPVYFIDDSPEVFYRDLLHVFPPSVMSGHSGFTQT